MNYTVYCVSCTGTLLTLELLNLGKTGLDRTEAGRLAQYGARSTVEGQVCFSSVSVGADDSGSGRVSPIFVVSGN